MPDNLKKLAANTPGSEQEPIAAEAPQETVHQGEAAPSIQINIPPKVDLSAFASDLDDEDVAVEQLQGPLNIRRFQELKDYVWVNPNPAYTSAQPYFLVDVPSDEKNGKPMLHLITVNLARQFLHPSQWSRMRFALASLPGDKFFLGVVPCRNLDNEFNRTMVAEIDKAKTGWRRILRLQDKEGYWSKPAEDPNFAPPPAWPSATLEELVNDHFRPHKLITDADHPGLWRVRGKPQRID